MPSASACKPLVVIVKKSVLSIILTLLYLTSFCQKRIHIPSDYELTSNAKSSEKATTINLDRGKVISFIPRQNEELIDIKIKNGYLDTIVEGETFLIIHGNKLGPMKIEAKFRTKTDPIKTIKECYKLMVIDTPRYYKAIVSIKTNNFKTDSTLILELTDSITKKKISDDYEIVYEESNFYIHTLAGDLCCGQFSNGYFVDLKPLLKIGKNTDNYFASVYMTFEAQIMLRNKFNKEKHYYGHFEIRYRDLWKE